MKPEPPKSVPEPLPWALLPVRAATAGADVAGAAAAGAAVPALPDDGRCRCAGAITSAVAVPTPGTADGPAGVLRLPVRGGCAIVVTLLRRAHRGPRLATAGLKLVRPVGPTEERSAQGSNAEHPSDQSGCHGAGEPQIAQANRALWAPGLAIGVRQRHV